MNKRTVSSIIVVSVIVLISLIVLWYFRYHYIPSSDIVISPLSDSVQVIPETPKEYGVEIDKYTIEYGVIGNNQTLGNLLRKYNLKEKTIQNIISIPRDVFDLRKIRAGNRYAVFITKDTNAFLEYFVYEKDLIEFARFHFVDDSIGVTHDSKPVEVLQKEVTGAINSSLWNAMVDNNYDPLLANELSEIYAWSIDFFGLQPGDSFSMVVDEKYVDTLYVGYGQVHAAYFFHSNKAFYAIPFVQDSIQSFYDEEGNSLRKAFLKAPLKYSRISSKFSNSRMHPILKIRRPHHGVDYAAPIGTPVFAIGDGKVITAKRGYNNGAGNYLKIKHNSVYTTGYLHLKSFAPGVSLGSYVKQGDLIGYVGSTGLSTGAHLDFRFYKNGKPIDPLKVEAPPVEPVHEENKADFDSVKAITMQLLDF